MIENIPEDQEVETYRIRDFQKENPLFQGHMFRSQVSVGKVTHPMMIQISGIPSNKAGANPFGEQSYRRTGGFLLARFERLRKDPKNLSKHVMYLECTHVLFMDPIHLSEIWQYLVHWWCVQKFPFLRIGCCTNLL